MSLSLAQFHYKISEHFLPYAFEGFWVLSAYLPFLLKYYYH